jgi:hypothetical protein
MARAKKSMQIPGGNHRNFFKKPLTRRRQYAIITLFIRRQQVFGKEQALILPRKDQKNKSFFESLPAVCPRKGFSLFPKACGFR